MRGTTILALSSVCVALALAGCAAETATTNPEEAAPDTMTLATEREVEAAHIEDSLHTYVSDWIQIDIDSDCCPGDANLYTGADPADGSDSYDAPAGGDTYIDWEDLADDIDNYRLIDVPESGKDPTAFPRANSCVGPANVLGKMDLTYVGAANNTDQAYFLVQRSANTGDAGYYWLISREAPDLDELSRECRPAEALLTFNIRGPDPISGAAGDVLLVGHFHESAGPQLRGLRGGLRLRRRAGHRRHELLRHDDVDGAERGLRGRRQHHGHPGRKLG